MQDDPTLLRRLLRGAGRLGVALLLVLATLGQVLAWTRPSWWEPVLQWWPAQYTILAAGVWRDALGVWNVVFVAVVLVLAVVSGRGVLRPLPVLAVAVLVSSVGLSTYQVVDARGEGADVGILAPTVPFQRGTVDPDRTVTVGTVDGADLDADLYLPDEAGDDGDGVPVVVYVHGGGFTSGSPAPSPYYPPLLERGYAVLDVSYRLASPQRQTWDTAVADVGCALTWVTTEGPAVGLDPPLGWARWATRPAASSRSTPPTWECWASSTRPAARPARSPTCRPSWPATPAVDGAAAYHESGLGQAYGDQYVGGPPEAFPERYTLTDSVNHVSAAGPPLLIYQGAADHLILPGPVRDFARASRDAGTTTRYVELPGLEHTTGGGLGTLSFGDLVGRDLATQWFVEHL